MRPTALLLLLVAGIAHADDDRCARGLELATGKDLTRARLYLEGCEGDDAASARKDVRKRMQDADYSELSISTNPSGIPITIDQLPGETLTSPTSVWVKAGTYTVATVADGTTYQSTVAVAPYTRASVLLDVKPKTVTAPKQKAVSFEQENALEQTTGAPPDVKRGSMIKGKFRGEMGPAGPQLADPLAYRDTRGPRPWSGVRIGGGVFDDGAASSSWRPSLALSARFTLRDDVFFAARLDWSRRGGTADTAIDSAGVSAGAGLTLASSRALAVAVLGQLRGDLRFADAREMTSVHRAGIAVATGVELAFPTTPLTAGLRFEQGLTELVDGARDRAVLLELGLDWR